MRYRSGPQGGGGGGLSTGYNGSLFTLTGASQPLFVINPTRQSAFVFNCGTSDVTITLFGEPAIAGKGIVIPAGTGWTDVNFSNEVQIIGTNLQTVYYGERN